MFKNLLLNSNSLFEYVWKFHNTRYHICVDIFVWNYIFYVVRGRNVRETRPFHRLLNIYFYYFPCRFSRSRFPGSAKGFLFFYFSNTDELFPSACVIKHDPCIVIFVLTTKTWYTSDIVSACQQLSANIVPRLSIRVYEQTLFDSLVPHDPRFAWKKKNIYRFSDIYIPESFTTDILGNGWKYRLYNIAYKRKVPLTVTE